MSSVVVIFMSDKQSYHHGNAREALLDTAEALIREKGISSFSLRAIARDVGIDPSACYRHFKNKEALLHGIASRGFTTLSKKMIEADNGESSRDAIINMGNAYVEFALADPLVFQIMFGGCGLPALDERLKEPTVEHTAFETLQQALLRYFVSSNESEDKLEATTMDIWSAVHGVAALSAFDAIIMDRDSRTAMIQRLVISIL